MRPVRPLARAFAAALALSLSAPSVFAFPAVPHHKRDVRAEVEAVDTLWRTALQTNDAAAMDKLLSDDYLGIMGNGQVLTKAQQLERVRSHTTDLTRLDISDMKIRLSGSVAVVTSLADLDGMMDGHKIHGSFRSMRVYQRRPGGTWKITNFEATPLRGPGAVAHIHDHDDDQKQ